MDASDSENAPESVENKGPFRIGLKLQGEMDENGKRETYLIVRVLGHGGRGQTYIATDESGRQLVLKTVRLDTHRSTSELFTWASNVDHKLRRESRALQRLQGVRHVAAVVDSGSHPYRLHDGSETPVSFIVREYVEGERFDEYLVREFSNGNGHFSGIASVREWFHIATSLANKLHEIHQREVIHRDIWHQNIFRSNDDFIFIDFGEAYFRDEAAIDEHPSRADTYLAPEFRDGDRWPSRRSDIYSLGGVFYFMATGQDPPAPIKNNEKLKEVVIQELEKHNHVLYADNHGIADIIARCLRGSREDRIWDAERLLQELRVFNPDSDVLSLNQSVCELNAAVEEQKANRSLPVLFNEIAAIEVQHLVNRIRGMTYGTVDLNGTHEELISGLTHYLSVLGDGDEYLAISIPDFWSAQNAGINGRFLSMNRLLAQRGVRIRRLFLVTGDDLDDQSLFRQVARQHLRKSRDLSGAKWETFVKEVESDERSEMVSRFQHNGVWISNDEAIRILPVYEHKSKPKLVTIRIRTYDGHPSQLRRDFEKELEGAEAIDSIVFD
jgi:serine/threonine-protein kinase